MTETAYKNCEVREFRFAEGSTKTDAHLEELEESKKIRAGGEEEDEHVVAELKGAIEEKNEVPGEEVAKANGSV